jgi:hypothetical protein
LGLDDRNCSRLFGRKQKQLISIGKHPAGNALLEGGRNSLLEFAQQATLSSVATSGFARQRNGVAGSRPNAAFQLQIHNRARNE